MLSRSGFFNIWVHPLDWEDFAIEFEGKWYVYTTLVFGWRPSASIYHICMGAVCSYLRTELHCPITHWIDDSTGSSRRRPGVVLDDSLVESPTSPGVPLPFSLIEANNASFLAATVMQGVGYFLSIAATCSVLGFYGKTQPFGLLSLTYLGYVLHLRLGGVPGRRGVGTPAKKALKYDVLRAAVAAGLRAGVLPTYTDLERVVCRYDSLRLQFPLMRLLLTACWAALGGEQRASRAEGSVVRRSQRLGHGAVLRADGPGAMAVMAAELDAIDFVTDAVVPLRWSRHVLAQLSVKRSRAHDGSCRVVATWRGPAGSWELGPATWEGAAADADAGVLAATAAALEEGALGPGVTDLRVELHCGDPFLLRVLLASAWALRCSIPGVGRIHHALRARNWDVVSCVREDVLFRPPRAGWGRGGSYMGLTRDVTRRVSDAFPSLAVDYFCEPWSAQFDTYVTRFPHARVEAALPPPCAVATWTRSVSPCLPLPARLCPSTAAPRSPWCVRGFLSSLSPVWPAAWCCRSISPRLGTPSCLRRLSGALSCLLAVVPVVVSTSTTFGTPQGALISVSLICRWDTISAVSWSTAAVALSVVTVAR